MNDYFEMRYQQYLFQGAILLIFIVCFSIYALICGCIDGCHWLRERYRAWKGRRR